MNIYKISIFALIFFFMAQLSIAQEKGEAAWMDGGLLHKTYNVPLWKIKKALDSVLGDKTISLRREYLKWQDTYIDEIGIGDKNGRYGNFTGVDTIKELKIKKGGIIISVKLVEKKRVTIVGFNVEYGDLGSAKILHELLADNLKRGLK